MATIWISEYVEQARDLRGYLVAAGQEPTLKEQCISHIGVKQVSEPFSAKTSFVRVVVDVPCLILFGTQPADPRGGKYLPANKPEFFGVPAGKALRIAVVANA
jgi:hypothetical protein